MAAMSLKLRATARAPISSALEFAREMNAFDAEVGREKQILASWAMGSPRNRRRSAEQRRRSFRDNAVFVSRRGRGHQARRQLFAKHFAEILFHFAFERRQQSFGNPFRESSRWWRG